MLWRKRWPLTCTMSLLTATGCAPGSETGSEPGADAAGADVCSESCGDSTVIADAIPDPDSSGPTDSAAEDVYAEPGADGAPDAWPDAGPDAAHDVPAEVEYDAAAEIAAIETWIDPGSGLEWLLSMTYSDMIWQDAVDYCASLGSGWHLPSVAELRTAIRGCASTELGGACSVSDGCSASSCETGACSGCSGPGPGLGGGYRDDHLKGACEWFWSSTACSDLADQAWAVNFHYASVAARERAVVANLWCAR
jgi:hypothetical protein